MSGDNEIDEITGLPWNKVPTFNGWLIVDEEKGVAYACAPTFAEARRKQLELGVRAQTTII